MKSWHNSEKPLRVLVADDELHILNLTKMLLKDMGFEVYTATNGSEAIQQAAQLKPDLIVTDVVMPEKNGFEVCQAVRNNPEIADTPLIIVSALGNEYNKITGFNEGADDYIIKPYNIDEFKMRVKALIFRTRNLRTGSAPISIPADLDSGLAGRITTNILALDECLQGGIPKGSNLLIVGPVGSGKSVFVRKFVEQSLRRQEKNLYIAIDDSPKTIRQMLSKALAISVSEYEQKNSLRFVDAYSWSTFTLPSDEQHAINGILELNQLAGIIADASHEIDQTIQQQAGGCRVIDSISSLLVNFDLPAAQRFISQLARTAIPFGNVTTLFVFEEGTVADTVLNNIKYLMDGIIEFANENDQYKIRVASMKWTKYNNTWVYYSDTPAT